MSKPKIAALVVTVLFIGLIIGLVVSSNLDLSSRGHTEISKDSIELLSRIDAATAEVAAAAKPFVVNISSTMIVHQQAPPDLFYQDPLLRQFFSDQFGQDFPRDYKESGLGSGVIVSQDGYILTNNHVVEGAEDIRVRLGDKREYTGTVVGADAKTDLAVVKIAAVGLPVATMGDSDKLRVGDRVIAVGNPFGLNQTVTTGIISAKGRADVGIADYEDFIQTDAPINPGNSGGALVNIRGELIGINTAIVSSSGGYQGIGFAIPSNMAKVVMESLIKRGKVVRGWLGVSIQSLSPDLAKQLRIKNAKGALVSDVMEKSPAEKAGLKRRDVIVGYDDKAVDDPTTLKNMVASTPPGKDVTIRYLREGTEKALTVHIEETPLSMKTAALAENKLRGVSVQDLSPRIRKALSLPRKLNGVLVTGVDNDSPAAGVLHTGDVITEINKEDIGSVRDFKAAVSASGTDQDILVLVYRKGSMFYVTM
ncbi:MAG: DegQ family serine endoprotease [Smithellaceae bacterium]|nr:DegQ family serine endoprotease [Smithellaceae bacterium]